MDNTIRLFQLAHRLALAALLLLIVAIPLITTLNAVTAFVILPACLIFIFTLSIVIEQKLASLALNKSASITTSCCLMKHCLDNNCSIPI